MCITPPYYRCGYRSTSAPYELSILSDPKEKGSGRTSGQNTNAGWYNRFVQTGKSDHETKSNECFGGQHVLYVARMVYWHGVCLVHMCELLLMLYSSLHADLTHTLYVMR